MDAFRGGGMGADRQANQGSCIDFCRNTVQQQQVEMEEL